MKTKKLPMKNSGGMYQDEAPIKRPGVKLKEKRSKKPSIYDDLDEFEDYPVNDDFDDHYYDDTIDDDDDDY